jgi:hypothetical protein
MINDSNVIFESHINFIIVSFNLYNSLPGFHIDLITLNNDSALCCSTPLAAL